METFIKNDPYETPDVFEKKSTIRDNPSNYVTHMLVFTNNYRYSRKRDEPVCRDEDRLSLYFPHTPSRMPHSSVIRVGLW
jgi:hypothetical protein